MSGAAALCSASVISTVRASIQALGDAVIGERRRDDAAAHQLADGVHRVARSRRHLAQHRPARAPGRSARRTRAAHRPAALARLVLVTAAATARCRSSSACSSRGGARPTSPSSASCATATSLSVTPDSADTTTTGARRRRLRLLLPDDADQPVDRVGIGDRRAAEFHHDAHDRVTRAGRSLKAGSGLKDGMPTQPQTCPACLTCPTRPTRPTRLACAHNSPSRCISSAFRIAAPAAPRIVLWPSATNL